jgi:hypothetical protein
MPEEFYRLLKGVVIDDADVFNDKLQEWEHFYNYARPHGALGGQTPYERLRQKTTLDVTRPRQSHSLQPHLSCAGRFLTLIRRGRKKPDWKSDRTRATVPH